MVDDPSLLSPGTRLCRPLFEFIHPDNLDRTLAAAQRHFGEGEQVVAFQNRYRHRDGTYRWLEWMSRMALDNSLACSVARDVTERKTLEYRRSRRQRALQTRNETLSERAVRDSLTDFTIAAILTPRSPASSGAGVDCQSGTDVLSQSSSLTSVISTSSTSSTDIRQVMPSFDCLPASSGSAFATTI